MPTRPISKKDKESGKHRYNATFELDDFLYLRAVALSESTAENPVTVQDVLNKLIKKARKKDKKIVIEHVSEKE